MVSEQRQIREAEAGLDMLDQSLAEHGYAHRTASLALQRGHRVLSIRQRLHRAVGPQRGLDVEVGAEGRHPVADRDAEDAEQAIADPDS